MSHDKMDTYSSNAGNGTMKYAIIQNGYALFGNGNTIEQCVNDANEWLDGESRVSLDDLIDNTNGKQYAVNIGDMFITDDAELIAEYTDAAA